MSILRFLVPALALAGSVLAQNSCSANTNTIQNQGDATALGNCATISGDVVIAEQTTGPIDLGGIQSIKGSLTCNGAINLTAITATNLREIGKNFELNGLILLATLAFPSLTSVDSISWTALPALQQLTFTSQVQKASNVLITNTQLTSLKGINLMQVKTFDINNNQYLKLVESQMTNVSTALKLEANGKDLIGNFPNLEWAYNITFRNCSDIKVPSLKSVNGSMGLFDNYFTSFTAPNMTSTGTGGSVVFVSNSQLTNVSMPLLTQVGGAFQLANNTAYDIVDGFPALSVVAGAIDLSGNFTSVSLPSLTDVRGGFNLQTSASLDCSAFQKYKNSGVIKGSRFVCSANLANPGTAGTTPSGTSGSGAKKGAAGRFEANVVMALGSAALISGFLHLML